MSIISNIVIIGSGNVAQHIADSCSLAGINLLQVFNYRAGKKNLQFAKKYNAVLVTDYAAITTIADLYIIAVKDDVIEEVAKKLVPLKLGGMVVHTSGSIDVRVLKNASKHVGVYYPLQTFYAGANINWPTTPLLIESNSKEALASLKKMADSISKKVKVANSAQRLQIHLAAVFACNFTNAMYVAAFEIIENNIGKNDTKLLLPIMQQSFQKLEAIHPRLAQTGPAVRNDKVVMKKHLSLLKHDKQLQQLYKQLSQLIISQQL